MCSLALSKTIIKLIDKFRKQCLWRGSGMNDMKLPKAAWKMIQLPKEEGGLGFLNIKQNMALLLKNLDKFFNSKDIPWVQLIWETLQQQEASQSCQKGMFFGGETF